MQKQVSKQSLAVLALSILLAISMALTATFASFTANKSAKATITFNAGNIAVTLSGGEWADDEGIMKITLDNAHFDIDGEYVVLNDAGVNAIKALKVTVTGVPTGFKVNLDVAITDTATQGVVTLEANDLTQQDAITNVDVFKTVTAVEDVDPADLASGVEFTVLVTATAVTAA